ncbi:MAG: hypothetical protein ACRDTU_15810 [Micromonosporaceae bacterium]
MSLVAVEVPALLGINTAQVDAFGSVLGGIGTIATLAVSLYLLNREMKLRRQHDLEEEVRQARLVHARYLNAERADINQPAIDDPDVPSLGIREPEDISKSVLWLVSVAIENYRARRFTALK